MNDLATLPPPKATTLRLAAPLQEGLALLQGVSGKPMNRMVNEAVQAYLEKRSAEVAAELSQTLARVQAWRRSDPGFEQAIDSLVDAEARHAKADPVEGQAAKRAGPAQAEIQALLRG